MLRDKPKQNKKIISVKTLGAKESEQSSIEKRMPATVIILTEVNLSMSQLDSGKPATNPTGKANNTPPQLTSDKPNFCCISGMREAQVAEIRPDKKKNAAVLHLIFVRSFSGIDNMGAKVATEVFIDVY